MLDRRLVYIKWRDPAHAEVFMMIMMMTMTLLMTLLMTRCSTPGRV